MKPGTFFSAYYWSVGSGLVIKSMGLISTLILVRLLSPYDFAVAAAAVIVLGTLNALTETGGGAYLQVVNTPTKSVINTAWTMTLLMRAFVACMILAAGPALAVVFKMEDLKAITNVLWIMPILGGLSNPGLFILRRELNYQVEAKLDILIKVTTTVATVSMAFAGLSYWSLLIGDILRVSLKTSGSYIAHNYRPKLALNNLRHQWRFSGWVTVTSITGYLRSKTETFFLSRAFYPEVLGIYSVAQTIAFLPGERLVFPATQPLLNTLKKRSQNTEVVKETCIKYLCAAYILIIPSSVLIHSMAREIVYIFLGDQWRPAVPFLQALPFLIIPFVAHSITRNLMLMSHKLRLQLIMDVVLILVIALPFLLALYSDVTQFLIYRVVVAGFYMCMLLSLLWRVFGVRFIDLAVVILLVTAPLLSMLPVLSYLNYADLPPFISMLAKVLLGGISYYAVSFLLIHSGRNTHFLTAYLDHTIASAFTKIKFIRD